MKNNKKHFHVVYSMQNQFELDYTVVFLYAQANCTFYVKVGRNKNVCVCVELWEGEREQFVD